MMRAYPVINMNPNLQQLQEQQRINPLEVFKQPSTDDSSSILAMIRAGAQSQLEKLSPQQSSQSASQGAGSGYQPMGDISGGTPNTQGFDAGTQRGILPSKFALTQGFGNYNPSVEKYSGGINYGDDFGAPKGTPLALPSGTWKVAEATNGGFNKGYGNSILAVNTQTGEKLRFSHLSGLNVVPGATLRGGSIISHTGDTGNVTGAHLDLEYYDKSGKVQDVLNSAYANELFGGQ